MSHASRASLAARLALQAQIIQVVADQPGITISALASLLGRTPLICGAIVGWMGRKGKLTIIRPQAHHQSATLYPNDGSAGHRPVRRPESSRDNRERIPAHAITDEDLAWMAYWKAHRDARHARATQENPP